MKKFQILRYVKKLRYLIVAVTILGCLATYVYVDKSQKYTAQVVIQYANSSANTEGNAVNPKEVYCSSVIADIKEDLSISAPIDSIRSACSFEEVLTEDEERRKNAILDEGDKYDEQCMLYRIKYTTDSSKTKEYTRNVLDSIINNYFVFYSKKYIDSAVIPNNSLNISADKYDYINCVEILESSTNEILDFLESKQTNYPNFRSARTGYSYANLRNEYRYIKNNTIAEYYALVLGDKLTNDKTELVNYYRNRIAKDEIEIENLIDHIAKQEALLDQFGDKVTRSNTTVAGAIGDNTDAIIEDVEQDDHRRLDVETEYDDLISYYVALKSQKNAAEIDIDRCSEILSIFDNENVKNSINTQRTNALVADMDETIDALNDLYEILCETVDEQYEHSATNHIKALTGIFVEESINTKLYMLMALILFLVVGCLGAVVIGRGADIWEYILYTDKNTGLPNRARCDMVIDSYAQKTLDDHFACITFTLNNLGRVNVKSGHDAGDSFLRRFGRFIRENAEEYGFVAYNGGNLFIALFENCTKERAEGFVDSLKKKMAISEPDCNFDISFGIAESTASHAYEVRDLIKESLNDLKS